MILTDKAERDFNEWYYKKIHFVGLCDIENHLDQTINALIIEFFDIFDCHIQITLKNKSSWNYEIHFFNPNVYEVEYDFNSRSEATQQAIIKANEIYNNLNTKKNEK